MSNQIPTNCGDSQRMRGLLEDTLPRDEQAELEAHLETCDACRRAFDLVAAEGRFWDDVRRFAVPGPNDPADQPRRTTMRSRSIFSSRTRRRAASDGSADTRCIEIVGRGGMGIVLKAFDPGLHRLVAIKVLSPRLATSAAARRRFLREARAAASVAHEHVVTIHAVDETNGLPYLVMQYVAGRSLQQRIDRDGPLELEAILRIGMQTAAGLAAAHAQGLVHRDVKPANILLENGVERVKITDFGLARAVDDASLTQSGVVAGTPQYMAPEQAGPKPSIIGPTCSAWEAYSTRCAPEGRPSAPSRPSPCSSGSATIRPGRSARSTRRSPSGSPRSSRGCTPRSRPTGSHRPWRSPSYSAGTWPASSSRRRPGCHGLTGRASDCQPSTRISNPFPSRGDPCRSPAGARLAWAAVLLGLLIGALALSEAHGVTHVSEYLAAVLRINQPSCPRRPPPLHGMSRRRGPPSMNCSVFVEMRLDGACRVGQVGGHRARRLDRTFRQRLSDR